MVASTRSGGVSSYHHTTRGTSNSGYQQDLPATPNTPTTPVQKPVRGVDKGEGSIKAAAEDAVIGVAATRPLPAHFSRPPEVRIGASAFSAVTTVQNNSIRQLNVKNDDYEDDRIPSSPTVTTAAAAAAAAAPSERVYLNEEPPLFCEHNSRPASPPVTNMQSFVLSGVSLPSLATTHATNTTSSTTTQYHLKSLDILQAHITSPPLSPLNFEASMVSFANDRHQDVETQCLKSPPLSPFPIQALDQLSVDEAGNATEPKAEPNSALDPEQQVDQPIGRAKLNRSSLFMPTRNPVMSSLPNYSCNLNCSAYLLDSALSLPPTITPKSALETPIEKRGETSEFISVLKAKDARTSTIHSVMHRTTDFGDDTITSISLQQTMMRSPSSPPSLKRTAGLSQSLPWPLSNSIQPPKELFVSELERKLETVVSSSQNITANQHLRSTRQGRKDRRNKQQQELRNLQMLVNVILKGSSINCKFKSADMTSPKACFEAIRQYALLKVETSQLNCQLQDSKQQLKELYFEWKKLSQIIMNSEAEEEEKVPASKQVHNNVLILRQLTSNDESIYKEDGDGDYNDDDDMAKTKENNEVSMSYPVDHDDDATTAISAMRQEIQREMQNMRATLQERQEKGKARLNDSDEALPSTMDVVAAAAMPCTDFVIKSDDSFLLAKIDELTTQIERMEKDRVALTGFMDKLAQDVAHNMDSTPFSSDTPASDQSDDAPLDWTGIASLANQRGWTTFNQNFPIYRLGESDKEDKNDDEDQNDETIRDDLDRETEANSQTQYVPKAAANICMKESPAFKTRYRPLSLALRTKRFHGSSDSDRDLMLPTKLPSSRGVSFEMPKLSRAESDYEDNIMISLESKLEQLTCEIPDSSDNSLERNAKATTKTKSVFVRRGSGSLKSKFSWIKGTLSDSRLLQKSKSKELGQENTAKLLERSQVTLSDEGNVSGSRRTSWTAAALRHDNMLQRQSAATLESRASSQYSLMSADVSLLDDPRESNLTNRSRTSSLQYSLATTVDEALSKLTSPDISLYEEKLREKTEECDRLSSQVQSLSDQLEYQLSKIAELESNGPSTDTARVLQLSRELAQSHATIRELTWKLERVSPTEGTDKNKNNNSSIRTGDKSKHGGNRHLPGLRQIMFGTRFGSGDKKVKKKTSRNQNSADQTAYAPTRKAMLNDDSSDSNSNAENAIFERSVQPLMTMTEGCSTVECTRDRGENIRVEDSLRSIESSNIASSFSDTNSENDNNNKYDTFRWLPSMDDSRTGAAAVGAGEDAQLTTIYVLRQRIAELEEERRKERQSSK